MQSLSIALGERTYPIYIGPGLLSETALFEANLPAGALCIVTNETVAPLYLDTLRKTLAHRRVVECVLPDGEPHKNLTTLARVFDSLIAGRVHRDGAIIALGGGVVGDMAGFAAACYQRGIACAQIPTTLLSQVDSSVGGKTAVNHPQGKNLIGAFHQPCAVFADTKVLQTLPDREMSAGLAEVIKYGLIEDASFFAWLESAMPKLRAREERELVEAISRSCAIKAQIVAEDERETTGRRALLNLGHTFGHAIETAVDYQGWLHGEAVGVGLLLASDLSARLGLIDPSVIARVKSLLESAGLRTVSPRVAPEQLWELMQMDKKVSGGKLPLVLLNQLGDAQLRRDVDQELVLQTLRHYQP